MDSAREIDIILNFIADTAEVRQMNQEMQQMVNTTQDGARSAGRMGDYYSAEYGRWRREQSLLSAEARAMQREMSYGWMQDNNAYIRARENMIAAQYGYYRLARAGAEYNGTTNDMMNQIYALGDAQRRARDQMMANNVMMRRSFMEQAGMFANMTTQAERISANYDRMRNPLLMINRGHLALAGALNRVANNGNAANIALRQLGPTASTKQLNDHIMMINQGLMRFQFVAIGSALTTGVLFYAMHKLSMMNDEYSSSLNKMLWSVYNALQPMLTVFRELAIGLFKTITAIAEWVTAFNDANPILARFIQGMMLLAPLITLLLSPLAIGIGLFGGFQAALFALWAFIGPMVTGLAAMTATVWVVVAALIALYMYFIATGETADRFRAKVDGMVASLVGKFRELAEAFPIIGQLGEIFTNAFNTVSNAIRGAIDGDFTALKDLFVQLIPTLIGIVVGGIPGLVISLSRFLPAVLQSFQGQSNMIGDFIKGFIDSFVQFFQTGLPMLLEVGAQLIQMIAQGIQNNLVNMVAGANFILQALIDTITQAVPILLELALPILMAIVEGIIQFMPVLIGGIMQLLQFILETLTTLLPVLLEAGLGIILVLINGIVQALPQLIEAAIQIIVTLLQALVELLPQLAEMGINIVVQLVQGLAQSLPQIVMTAIKLIATLIETIVGMLPDILSMGGQVVATLVLGIGQLVWELAKAAVNLITAFVGKWKEFDWIGIGKNIIAGIISGIKNAAGALGDAALGMAKSVGGAVKSFFKIASPSKLMKEYGAFVTEGFSIGMVAEVPKAVQAAEHVSGSVASEFGQTAAMSNYATTNNSNWSNNSNVTINIDGKKDTSNAYGLQSLVNDSLDMNYDYLKQIYSR